MTIKQLPALISDTGLRSSVEALIAKVEKNAEFCRDWRNRHIAHRDLALTLGNSAKPLAAASRLQATAVLKSLAEVLNAISIHFGDGETAFDIHDPSDGSEALLYVLHDGLAAHSAKIDRMQSGTARPEDWQAPAL